jgi:hypothetical protein
MTWHRLWRICLVSEESEGASHESGGAGIGVSVGDVIICIGVGGRGVSWRLLLSLIRLMGLGGKVGVSMVLW